MLTSKCVRKALCMRWEEAAPIPQDARHVHSYVFSPRGYLGKSLHLQGTFKLWKKKQILKITRNQDRISHHTAPQCPMKTLYCHKILLPYANTFKDKTLGGNFLWFGKSKNLSTQPKFSAISAILLQLFGNCKSQLLHQLCCFLSLHFRVKVWEAIWWWSDTGIRQHLGLNKEAWAWTKGVREFFRSNGSTYSMQSWLAHPLRGETWPIPSVNRH